MSLTQILLLLIIGLFAGMIGGSMGVGGGIVIVPSLVLLMGFSQHEAQGTSLAVLLFPVAILGVINYYRNNYVNFRFALILIIAFIIGSYFGSLISVNIPEKILKKIFGLFMLLVSLRLLLFK
ncbi:MAG: sulfite exporter TauE/SafE family protein [Bacteroidales bacterium]|nr:MAG: sulfite exporter TauE/SafE family protein [Bacteroidales bacterium]